MCGSAAMIGKHKDATVIVKQRSPNCEFLHYITRREALACKKVKVNSSNDELDKLISNVVKIVNAIRQKAKIRGLFSKLCDKNVCRSQEFASTQ